MLICDIWAAYLLSSGAPAFDCSHLCHMGEIFRQRFQGEVIRYSVDVASVHLPTAFILTTHDGCSAYECNGAHCGNFYHLKTIGQIRFK